ncbi:MAG TPA: HAMP domain-containing sensor histidine kinase [Bacteroidia bacterium]|nr:HAMP domain-containing sensor histidine kinase [Bacteroidia bacterium]HRS57906.1 HAMP domain-containing sensor histidine kinase [Bacteroidia bacterium]HRU68285.1 HAMP domain-containing sensor histidine kinase [Bacteroidia bacterium]
MINYQQKKYWKLILLNFAILISIGSLVYTRYLVEDLKKDQYKTVSLLADAYTELISSFTDPESVHDISFLFKIIMSNENIPVILADTNDNILEFRNLDSSIVLKDSTYLKRQLASMKKQYPPIPITFSNHQVQLIYYKNSKLITQLTIYPYVQLFLVILFVLVSYFAFNSSRKYEQNKVWSGMSRETAHQLGTPVSSLIALKENIKLSGGVISAELLDEFEKDTKRLELITDRFSKIGSIPKPEIRNIYELITESVNYLKPRLSKRVKIVFEPEINKEITAPVIPSLFDWVIENLCKNAINAIEGNGEIKINITENQKNVFIDISDTGKGIPKSKFRTIFKAGYTTSQRGWGLGLSLSKRIIEMFHKGKIFVKDSVLGKGTTFRIVLRKKPFRPLK